MASTTKTARNLTPAYGELETAVVLMAVRYAEAHAAWLQSLLGPARDRDRLRRTDDRRFKALCRLTAALANR